MPSIVALQQNGTATAHHAAGTADLTPRVAQPPQTTSVIVLTTSKSPPNDVIQSLLHDHLPAETQLLGIGGDYEAFSHLTDKQWASIDVVLKWGGKEPIDQAVWRKLTNLRWIHSIAAGLENTLFPELIESDVVVTNAKGVTAHSLAEFAFAAIYHFAKQVPRLLQSKAARHYDVYQVQELRGATLGLVGYGAIGQRAAELARAHEMRVIAVRRNTQLSQDEVKQGLLDAVYAPQQLHTLLSQSDYVLISTPHTPETDKLIDAAAIAALKPDAVVVNVGRGKCVDEEALIKALEAGYIKGAGLDVTEIEPLPSGSPLWDLPNVLLSYHSAARTSRFARDSAELFVENLKRYLAGEELLNVVDKKQQY